jgi:hypothetical protein
MSALSSMSTCAWAGVLLFFLDRSGEASASSSWLSSSPVESGLSS